MGLGDCLIGSALPAFNATAVRAQLKIPDKYFAAVPIVLGYLDDEMSPTPRKPPVILSNISAS